MSQSSTERTGAISDRQILERWGDKTRSDNTPSRTLGAGTGTAGLEAHRTNSVLDHPDGSVTAAKLALPMVISQSVTTGSILIDIDGGAGTAIRGQGADYGVIGFSNGAGVAGASLTGIAVYGLALGSSPAMWGAGFGLGGRFTLVAVGAQLSKVELCHSDGTILRVHDGADVGGRTLVTITAAKMQMAVPVALSTQAVNATATILDTAQLIRITAPGPYTLTLPATPVPGAILTIHDESGLLAPGTVINLAANAGQAIEGTPPVPFKPLNVAYGVWRYYADAAGLWHPA